MQYLLDTNIILAHLASPLFDASNAEDHFFVSVISEAELLRYPGIGKKEIAIIEDFLSAVTLIPVDSPIARRAAELGRTRKTKLPDLLIASTALELDVPLITKNVKDFTRIQGLLVKNKLS
ncbi:MAG: type II toxin-antitoxin system VapC family toxin [Candidatus Kerfeldbacteria bacterium]|nr:type II toxin-antitoxin system VapC family toxin [Candidatus Kerfeldbacteria bacterium]